MFLLLGMHELLLNNASRYLVKSCLRKEKDVIENEKKLFQLSAFAVSQSVSQSSVEFSPLIEIFFMYHLRPAVFQVFKVF